MNGCLFTRCWLPTAAIAVVLAATAVAAGGTTLFGDDCNSDTYYTDVNVNVADRTYGIFANALTYQQYRGASVGYSGTVGRTTSVDHDCMTVGCGDTSMEAPEACVTIDYNFNGVNATGGLDVAFNSKLTCDGHFRQWLGVAFTSTNNGLDAFNNTPSFMVQLKGRYDDSQFPYGPSLAVYEGGTQVATGFWYDPINPIAVDTFHDFLLEIRDDDGNPFDGNGPASLALYVDGATTPAWTYTTSNAYSNAYPSFISSGSAPRPLTYCNTGAIDDLSVTRVQDVIPGDTDLDDDVDNSDLITAFGNFTGPGEEATMAPLSGNPDVADLIYDPASGNVRLDASEAAGEVITGFVLKNDAGGDEFVTGVVDFPFAGAFRTDLPTEISNTDGMMEGFSGIWDLGDIFVPGLDETSLSAWLTKATYVGALGTGVHTFDLTVVPEPSTFALLLCALAGLAAYARRRK